MIDFTRVEATEATRLAYKPAEAARQLGISERSLWTLTNDGKVRAIKIGRCVRYPHVELERFLQAALEENVAK